jgi:hypothetical protein
MAFLKQASISSKPLIGAAFLYFLFLKNGCYDYAKASFEVQFW